MILQDWQGRLAKLAKLKYDSAQQAGSRLEEVNQLVDKVKQATGDK